VCSGHVNSCSSVVLSGFPSLPFTGFLAVHIFSWFFMFFYTSLLTTVYSSYSLVLDVLVQLLLSKSFFVLCNFSKFFTEIHYLCYTVSHSFQEGHMFLTRPPRSNSICLHLRRPSIVFCKILYLFLTLG
jgi:hypothetical protein